MCAGKRILLLILVIASGVAAHAQRKSKSQLQREKQQSVERIKEVEKILNETTAKKKNTLGELTALNQRIIEQQNLIHSIRTEISLLNTEIKENNEIIEVLDDDLKKMKKEYAAMLFAAQKASNSTTRLTQLLCISV